MDQTFIKDNLHRTESLIWSNRLLQAFYYHSDYKLKMDELIRTMSNRTGPIKIKKFHLEILKFQCISVCNNISNHYLDLKDSSL